MAWLRETDGFDEDPAILGICRTESEVNQVVGILTRLKLYCARQFTDGFVPEIKVKAIVRSRRMLELLTGPPSGGRALLHRRGDACDCLKDRSWPATGADYFVHHYLLSNPSKDEYDVQRAKQAELRDRQLQAEVRHRDLNRCRYCSIKVVWADRRSAAGGVFDHVDPNLAAGASNLVVACRGCNSRKGHRTPAAASMTLLPAPSTRPDQPADPERDLTRTTWSAADPTTHARARDGTGRVAPVQVGPPRLARTSAHPNPYHRDSINGQDPTDHAGLPTVSDVDNAYLDQFREEFNNGP